MLCFYAHYWEHLVRRRLVFWRTLPLCFSQSTKVINGSVEKAYLLTFPLLLASTAIAGS